MQQFPLRPVSPFAPASSSSSLLFSLFPSSTSPYSPPSPPPPQCPRSFEIVDPFPLPPTPTSSSVAKSLFHILSAMSRIPVSSRKNALI
ncbi:hypothetical protein QJS04_geneDACA002624 [Acorus gramineus]|uniref:Uncharacterized protein n=1 Tax=Acorus gramineus TaxID=55184 RepID=A0AAV9AQ93_ACOGR|nr:hypothetical protein QJS04_geneDACA002624 [Acorus gramineus]